ncbi:Acetyl-coenzyme A synthetase [Actinomadura sp. RB99]|uniref:AMP-binding protein n=1 Tax=Actinomadura sp. RB99 TaxID=2691577 RepID=UPI0016882613|nr:AMP-binding protein [Actinomadura sp. RB99]MBD2892578.1 Acetyl-coenzyme A synthetase [Actinomadura sp. RB99]
MTGLRRRVADVLAAYDAPQACLADILCDRHPAGSVAFTIAEPGPDGGLACADLTYGELRDRSARFAAGLRDLGVGPGDRVAMLMGKSADLVVAMLGIWRLGAVQVPLFTALAPPAIAARVTGNGTVAVITDPAQRAKLDAIADPGRTVITTGAPSGTDVAFAELAASPPLAEPVAAGGDATMVELFTSGTTGVSKGVPVPVRALAAMRVYQEYGLDHRASDVFWNAADPGWAYGLYHAVIGPLLLGRRAVLLRGGFSPELTWQVLARCGVTNFAAGPTVYRALRNAADAMPGGLRLRCCSSAGEPLNPDVVAWAESALGVPVRDHYGQTELGMAVANGWHPDIRGELRPGSMGRPLPGWRLRVLRPDADEAAPAGEPGRVAVDLAGSPLMWFTGYRDAPGRTAERFTADRRWYLTGDTAAEDADGYFHFAARDDDVILMAGYRIGPFEVESVLLQHDDVAEAAVVGVPDDLRGEILVANIVLRPGTPPSDALAAELQTLVKTRFAAHAYPREVHFVDGLPKTPSGKLQRFLLRPGRPHARPSASTAER